MQIKKDEIRLKILETATDEFLIKGYENASMRTIARKSHTTLGNIYHYYQNKETLLETILLPTIENIETMISRHIEYEQKNSLSKEEMLYMTEHLEEIFDQTVFACFIDKRVVILIRLQSTHLLERKEKIIQSLLEHLQQYFNMDNEAHYTEIILEMMIECVKHVLIEHDNPGDAKAEFIKFFKFICYGIAGQQR